MISTINTFLKTPSVTAYTSEVGLVDSLGYWRTFVVFDVLHTDVPVGSVALHKASNDDKTQHHQVDACEDLVHQG